MPKPRTPTSCISWQRSFLSFGSFESLGWEWNNFPHRFSWQCFSLCPLSLNLCGQHTFCCVLSEWCVGGRCTGCFSGPDVWNQLTCFRSTCLCVCLYWSSVSMSTHEKAYLFLCFFDPSKFCGVLKSKTRRNKACKQEDKLIHSQVLYIHQLQLFPFLLQHWQDV